MIVEVRKLTGASWKGAGITLFLPAKCDDDVLNLTIRGAHVDVTQHQGYYAAVVSDERGEASKADAHTMEDACAWALRKYRIKCIDEGVAHSPKSIYE